MMPSPNSEPRCFFWNSKNCLPSIAIWHIIICQIGGGVMMPVQAQKTKKRKRETGKHGTPYPLPVTGGRTLSREKHCQQAAYGLGTFKLRSKPEGLIGHALGLKIDDVNESIKIVKEGLPFPSLQHLGRELEMSNVELALT